jgi:hypothetical protein
MLWKRQKHLIPTYIDAWMVTYEAAAVVDAKREKDTASTPLVDRWRNNIRSTMQLLDDIGHALYFSRVMDAQFSNDVKIAMCQFSPVAIWMNPLSQCALLNILPTEEYDRFSKLPWFENDEGANRQVAFAYSPHSASLLDSLIGPDVWKSSVINRAMIKDLLAIKTAAIEPVAVINGDLFENAK